MRISERGQITIPKRFRDRFGMNKDVEVEITPTEHGLLIPEEVGGTASGREGQWNPRLRWRR